MERTATKPSSEFPRNAKTETRARSESYLQFSPKKDNGFKSYHDVVLLPKYGCLFEVVPETASFRSRKRLDQLNSVLRLDFGSVRSLFRNYTPNS